MRSAIPAIVAALAIWATGAYPPWKESLVVSKENGESGVAVTTMTTAIGNDWLFNEKALPGHTSLQTLGGFGIGYSVDFGRLGVEWAIIAALYGAVALAVRRAPREGGEGDGEK